MASAAASSSKSLASKLAERFFYDFSLYKAVGHKYMDYNRYVMLRHNLTLVGGFYVLLIAALPFKPAFPTMGMCPSGYDGTFVCEPDHHKAMEMYKQWKAGKGLKPKPDAHGAAVAAPAAHH